MSQKHAARIGLGFTSPYATVTMRSNEINEFLKDVAMIYPWKQTQNISQPRGQ